MRTMLSRKDREYRVDTGQAGASRAAYGTPEWKRFQRLILTALLVVITLLVFQSVRSYQFLSWDDKFNITVNEHMNRPGGPDYGFYWRTPYTYSYRPLIFDVWSFIADHARLKSMQSAPGIGEYRFSPRPFHTFNWVFHAINVVLVFLLLRVLVRRDYPAFAGALLFGLHPFQDESVAWITGGNELLYGFFALLTILEYLSFAAKSVENRTATSPRTSARTQPLATWDTADTHASARSNLMPTHRNAGSPNRRESSPGKRSARPLVDSRPPEALSSAVTVAFKGNPRIHYCASCLLYMLALLAKPTAVCLPLIAAALDIWAIRRPVRKVLLSLAPWIPVALVWIYVTAWARQLDTTVAHTALWIRPLVAGDAVAFYLYKIIVPFNMAVEYSRDPAFVMAHAWVYATFLIPIAIAVLLWMARSAYPLLLAAYTIFLAALLPTLGLVPNHYQFYSTVADHYMYLAMLGPAIALSWLLADLSWERKPGKIVAAAYALFLALCGARAAIHARDFRNDETLYLQTIATNPRSWVSHYNYGRYLADQGKYEGSITHLQAAVALKPDLADGYNNLGVTLSALGRNREALDQLQKAVELDPHNPSYRTSIAIVYDAMGRYSDAAANYTAALQTSPNAPDTEFRLGTDLSSIGQLADAETHLTRSLALAPGNAPAENNLATVLVREGKIDEAIPHWQKAIQLEPNYARAYYNYGSTLEQMGRTRDAIAEYEAALRLQPQYARAQTALSRLLGVGKPGRRPGGAGASTPAQTHETLGLQWNSHGNLPEAAAEFEQAVNLAPNNPGYRANYGLILSNLGRRAEAIEQLEAAVRLNPTNAVALDNLGVNQAQSGMFAKAIDNFKRALAIRPTYPEAEANLGYAFALTGDKTSAIAHFRTALKERPGFARAQQGLDRALSGQ
ncbi:MAG: tetratricopeptide repeat protein [Capsulimonadaceae bacterium]